MKVLAVYGSTYGQAEAVMRRVAATLQAHGHDVQTFKGDAVPADLAVVGFDAVIVAASIIVGKYQAYIRAFVRRHAAALRTRPTAFISVSGTSPESVPEWQAAARKYVSAFALETGWEPRWTATFSGALRYQHYNLVTRWIMKMIARRAGGPTDTSREYEFTDWSAVDRFASELGTALGPGAAQPAPLAGVERRAGARHDDSLHVRPEQPGDETAIAQLTDAAFGGPAESRVIDRIRQAGHQAVSLVAVEGGQIVGHILFTRVGIDTSGPSADVMGLGPMAVRPALQRRGIGSTLVREGLQACARAGCRAVVVLGHPEYYPRFGFRPASTWGLRCAYPAPDEAFMALELAPGALRGHSGLVRYLSEFDDADGAAP